MSKFGTLTGKNLLIGHGVPVAFPITLDPAPFEGSVVYADNGELRYSNGTTWEPLGTGPQGTQGNIGIQGNQGVQGDYGPGFTIIGAVADVDSGGDPQATLNTAFGSANIGEGVIDDADDELCIYDGTIWVNIGSFRGVQGLQGIAGSGGIGGQGTQGIQGVQGSDGPQGLQGNDGGEGQPGRDRRDVQARRHHLGNSRPYHWQRLRRQCHWRKSVQHRQQFRVYQIARCHLFLFRSSSPRLRPIISFIISDVPPKIRLMRAS